MLHQNFFDGLGVASVGQVLRVLVRVVVERAAHAFVELVEAAIAIKVFGCAHVLNAVGGEHRVENCVDADPFLNMSQEIFLGLNCAQSGSAFGEVLKMSIALVPN